MKNNIQLFAESSSFLGKKNGIIAQVANIIAKITQKIENIPGKYLEIIACAIYVVAHLLMAIVHEPWYDESVAWNIARSASIKDILFTIPHYEGHPPLWHLILLPWAKLGAPYELSLSLISLFFAGAACALIVWRAPFPRAIRLLLPFTYFLFYQYGVISRPYCVMMLAFILLAIEYHKRNERPLRYTLLLMLLCFTSAYGIVIAGGLALVWVFEILRSQKISMLIKNIFKDKRFWCLLVLLFLALALICEIAPREDTFATTIVHKNETNGILFCLCYMLFAIPLEVSLSSIYIEDGLLKCVEIYTPLLIAICLLGILFWIISISWGKSKKTSLALIIPYVLFSVFASIVYIGRHHIGVGLLFLVFWFWITCSSKSNEPFAKRLPESNGLLIKNVLIIVGFIAMIISLYWNISSCVQDVFCSYATGRNEAQFIKEHNLDEYRMMVGWNVYSSDNEDDIDMDINHCHYADNVAPYFDHNLFFNFNEGRDDVNYSTHQNASDEYTASCVKEWKKQLPDVCLMRPMLEVIYKDIDFEKEYTLVYENRNNMVWKGMSLHNKSTIYVRTDLLETLGLEPIY